LRSGPHFFAARWGGGSRMDTHWSGHRGPAAGGRESRAEKVESRHRGPPPRHPVSGPRRKVCSDGCPADGGWADPGLFSAQRGADFPTSAQWSGHRGPPPRHPVSGPRRKVFSDGCPADGGWGRSRFVFCPAGRGFSDGWAACGHGCPRSRDADSGCAQRDVERGACSEVAAARLTPARLRTLRSQSTGLQTRSPPPGTRSRPVPVSGRTRAGRGRWCRVWRRSGSSLPRRGSR